MSAPLPAPTIPGQPLTALAPMQDVTDLAFMRVAAHYGAPDYFVTEFFRVHSQSRPEKHILRAIDENTTGRPVFAQLIGEDIAHLARTIDELLRHPVAGIDLNLGCPAPKVYKKNVGGGLLREPDKISKILAAIRAAVPGLFTVKMRIGFEDTGHYDAILDLVNEHRIDLLAVHGRTVRELYRGEVHYDAIARAVARVRCPVMANGNITSAAKAARVLAETRAAGVMIGRHAIRNPWIFRQCREHFAGRPVTPVTFADVRDYIGHLFNATRQPGIPENAHVSRMKKFLNFTGQSVDPDGAFLRDMRRATTAAGLFAVCDRHLLAEPAREFALEPYPGVIARPNCEMPDSAAAASGIGGG
ncbi:tRNA-dihydrouridine synthase family protein [Termitidicoccus mucosus]|uniref:tRNA-dihydrouridine synthase n=1 Tax=Termitidicoccus mucosus TaxID=1184151 RepID=A0A178INC0_9BACT|nr:dihydrouridine synthase [Opitutaceae bacterium TSB47]